MLAYSDKQASPLANPTLVNDIDLKLIDPNGIQYFPLTLNPADPAAAATPEANHLDNVEQVVVANPVAGTWTIRVHGYTMPPPVDEMFPQEYAVSWYFPATTMVMDQKIEGTSQQVGTLGRWSGSSFNPRFSPGLPHVLALNTPEVFHGDTNVYLQNKYREWVRGPIAEDDLRNHHVFPGFYSSEISVTSRFATVSNATIQARMIDGGNPGGNIHFTDPWYIDFTESPYGNRNRGTAAIPQPVPYAVNIGINSPHKGVFLDQPIISGKPYYTVGAPDHNLINGFESYFLSKWSGTYVTFQDSFALQTPAVFNFSGGSATAWYKAKLGSSMASATGSNSQRVAVSIVENNVNSSFILYESAGDVWRNSSTDGGVSWSFERRVSSGSSGAPSVALWKEDGLPFVSMHLYSVYRKQVGSDYQIMFTDALDESYIHEEISPTISTAIDTRPVISRIDFGGTPFLYAFWEGPGGLWFNSAEGPGPSWHWGGESLLEGGPFRNPSTWGCDITSYFPELFVSYDNGTDVFAFDLNFDLHEVVPASVGPVSYASQISGSNIIDPESHIVWEAWGGEEEPPPSTDAGDSWNSNVPMLQRRVMYQRWHNKTWDAAHEFKSSTPFINYYRPTVVNLSNGHLVWAWDNGMSTFKAVYDGKWEVMEIYNGIRNPNLLIPSSNGPIDETRFVATGTTGAPYPLVFGTETSRPGNGSVATVIPEQYSRRAVVARRPSHRPRRLSLGRTPLTANESSGEPDSSNYFSVEVSSISLKLNDGSLVPLDFASTSDSLNQNTVWSALTSAPIIIPSTIDSIIVDGEAKVLGPLSLTGSEIGLSFDIVDADRGTPLRRINTERLYHANGRQPLGFRDRVAGLTGRRIMIRPTVRGFSNTTKKLLSTVVHVHTLLDDSLNESRSLLAKQQSATTASLPSAFMLHQNYPNPFNPTTEIRFDLPDAGNVSLVVYDVLGREVVELASGYREAGYHSATWNAAGQSSGVYFARFNVTNAEGKIAYSKINKLVLMK